MDGITFESNVREVYALATPDLWLREQSKIADIDKKLAGVRG
ncbi:MAG: hypothetical protein ACLP0A_09225 [Verrucomicrobiia bacterium]